jgi:thiol-disulfide isomerase/thioredoxin
MKKVFLLAIVIIFTACKPSVVISNTPNSNNNAVQEKNKPIIKEMLVGKIMKSELQLDPFVTWFNPGERDYTPKPATIAALKKISKEDLTITIFMGTWCSDSQTQVPRFYKILTEMEFDTNNLTLIAMTKDKTTPEKYEQALKITNVPTFIFYKKGTELQRIVESPVETLEEDMLKILSGMPYKHTYE